jgi:crotonobetainyl-CoA:carnitine CoA-transferase CaiB-like acyl-CoA transferase
LASVDKFFQNLTTAVRHPEWASDERFSTVLARQSNYEVLTQLLQAAFTEHDTAHWQACLTEHDIPHAPISSIDQVVTDPQVVHNGVFAQLKHPTKGIVKNTQRPVLYDGERSGGDMAPPVLGEHSLDVLRQLGFDAKTIDAFVKEGAIASSVETPLKSL